MAKPLVVIFARAPSYGAAKTRLAREIGAAETLRFYRITLSGLVRRMTRDERVETMIAVTPDPGANGRTGLAARARVVGQGHGDLGRRMIRALRAAGKRPAVVIGSDIPGLRSCHVAQAFRALARAPFVLGPARDGGYWLIGARHPSSLSISALDGVRWSTPHTRGDTVKRLRNVVTLQAVLDDVDDEAAYRRLSARP